MIGRVGFQTKLSFASVEEFVVSIKSQGEELEMKEGNKTNHTRIP